MRTIMRMACLTGALALFGCDPNASSETDDSGGELSRQRAGAAGMQGMSKHEYMVADGGPHLFLPAEVAGQWRGAPSMMAAIDPKSDYGRACAATLNRQMGAVVVGHGKALAFSDPPMTAWGRSADRLVEVYYLDDWSTMNLDGLIDNATASLKTSAMKKTGVRLKLGEPGAFLLFAGDTPGRTAYGAIKIDIPAGGYEVLEGTYRKGRDTVTVYRFRPARPAATQPASDASSDLGD